MAVLGNHNNQFSDAAMNVFPLSYSAPEEIFRLSERPRTKLVADLVPGDRSTYIYDNEEDYYNMYQEARFGITHKKSSWDCLRHYEIIANGAIPLFRDIEGIHSADGRRAG